MNKKQKKMLIRIVIAAVLVVAFSLIPMKGYVKFVLFMIPYLVIGYDILKKAGKGILNRQMFDENFLMAVATIGAILLGDYKEGVAVMITTCPLAVWLVLPPALPAFLRRPKALPVNSMQTCPPCLLRWCSFWSLLSAPSWVCATDWWSAT